jgi:hypothetical protein
MSDSLLNETRVRAYTLDMLKNKRPHLAAKKTRISQEYIDRIEARLRAIIVNEVDVMSTTGATIK